MRVRVRESFYLHDGHFLVGGEVDVDAPCGLPDVPAARKFVGDFAVVVYLARGAGVLGAESGLGFLDRRHWGGAGGFLIGGIGGGRGGIKNSGFLSVATFTEATTRSSASAVAGVVLQPGTSFFIFPWFLFYRTPT